MKNALFFSLSVGCSPCRRLHYNIYKMNVKKYIFFYLMGGRKNPAFSLRIRSYVWVIFLDTDCKINALFSPFSPQFIHIPFPLAKTYSPTTNHHHLSTYRSTLNLFHHCNRYQVIHNSTPPIHSSTQSHLQIPTLIHYQP